MRTYLAALCLAAATGCGYVGAPLPPALNIPEKIATVHASQHGSELVIGFLITGRTTDGLVVRRLREVDLRIGPPAASMDAWAKGASRIPVEEPKIDGFELRSPITGWENRDVVIAVRAVGPTGRPGAWSEPMSLRVVGVPPVPVVAAEPGPDGVVLSWPRDGAPAGAKWRIYRQGKDDKETVAIGEAADTRWVDTSVEEDGAYSYQVQTLAPADKGFAESERSKSVSTVYRDVFPPAAPQALSVIAGVGTIELTWEPNHERDLRGYQMYRAEVGGTPAKYGELTGEVTFSDSKLEHGKRYVYAVAAVDKLGNSSKLSATVEATAP